MAEYTVKRNERIKDKELNFDLNGISKLVFEGTVATAELTDAQVEYLRAHGYEVEDGSGESATITALQSQIETLTEANQTLTSANQALTSANEALTSQIAAVESEEASIITRSITSVTIPDGIASIGDYAFANCGNLVTINIPESVETIGSHAFADISSSATINCEFVENAVNGAPWGAPQGVTINYAEAPTPEEEVEPGE